MTISKFVHKGFGAFLIVLGALIFDPPAYAANTWIQVENLDNDTVYVVDVANWGTQDRSPVHLWPFRIGAVDGYTDNNQRWTPVVKAWDIEHGYTIALGNRPPERVLSLWSWIS